MQYMLHHDTMEAKRTERGMMILSDVIGDDVMRYGILIDGCARCILSSSPSVHLGPFSSSLLKQPNCP